MERRKKIVSKYLLFYPDIKKQYIKERSDILQSSSAPPDGLPRGTKTSDTTGDRAQRSMSLPDADWMKLVEDVAKDISPRMQIYLKLRQEYRHGRNWFIPVQSKYCYAVAEAEGIEPEACWVGGRQYFFIWWEQICNYAIVRATERNLF